MDQSVEFLIKISITIVLSLLIFVGMMELQIRKELRAKKKYDETLKTNGLEEL